MSVTYPKGGLQSSVEFQQNGKAGTYPVQAWNDEIGTFQFSSTLADGSTIPAGAAVVVPVGGDGVRLPQDGDALVAGQTVGAKAADGSVTFASLPAADETVTVGTVAYKFVAEVADANDVKIGATVAETAANLASAINGGAGIGSLYGKGTEVNSDAEAVHSGNSVVGLFARAAGAAGNSTALATTSANITVSGATLTGGADAGEAAEATAHFAGVVAYSYWLTAQKEGYCKSDLDVNVPVKQKGYITVLMSSLSGAEFGASVTLDYDRPGYFKVASAEELALGKINKVYADYGTCEIALQESI